MTKAQEPLALCLVFGPELTRRKKVIERLKSKVNPDFFDFNFEEIIVNGQTTAQDIIASAQSMPFGEGSRVVIVDFGEKPAKELSDGLCDYIAQPNPSTILCMVADAVDKRSKLYKAVSAYNKTALISCEDIKKWKLADFVVAEAQKLGKTMHKNAAEALVQRSGENTLYLQKQVANLASLVGDRDIITIQDVKDHISWTAELKPWIFTDFVCQRDTVACLEYIERMKKSDYTRFHFAVVQKLRELICARACIERGNPSALSYELTQAYGKRKADGSRTIFAQDWQLKNHITWAYNFTTQELVEALRKADICEQALKGFGMEEKSAFITFICSVTEPANSLR